MKLQIASDLHLDFDKAHGEQIVFAPDSFSLEPTDADILILAGDIWESKTNFKTAIPWFCELSSHYPHVIYIYGNHEYYGMDINDVNHVMEQTVTEINLKGHRNFHLLNNQSVKIDRCRFIGATLWTDYNRNERFMKVAESYMADHTLIEDRTSRNKKFGTRAALQLHENCKGFIRRELADEKDSTIERNVVITHHLPSYQSVHPMFGGSLTNPAFASHLDALVAQSDLWIHGHTHKSCDYELEGCRVVCNPRGYFPKEVNLRFRPALTITV